MLRKTFLAVLVVALLGSAVGVGIHILHRDARAEDLTFTAYLTDVNEFPVNSEDIILHFDIHNPLDQVVAGGFDLVFISQTAGYSRFVEDIPSNATQWKIWIELGADAVEPVDPVYIQLPTTHHDWVVDPW